MHQFSRCDSSTAALRTWKSLKLATIYEYERECFFSKKHYLARKKFYLAFFDVCNPRHMYSVTKHDLFTEKLFAEGLDPCNQCSTFWL